jgi:hypothetical protein
MLLAFRNGWQSIHDVNTELINGGIFVESDG